MEMLINAIDPCLICTFGGKLQLQLGLDVGSKMGQVDLEDEKTNLQFTGEKRKSLQGLIPRRNKDCCGEAHIVEVEVRVFL